jgi:hypothetical protein
LEILENLKVLKKKQRLDSGKLDSKQHSSKADLMLGYGRLPSIPEKGEVPLINRTLETYQELPQIRDTPTLANRGSYSSQGLQVKLQSEN